MYPVLILSLSCKEQLFSAFGLEVILVEALKAVRGSRTGIGDYRATSSMLNMPFLPALKAEAFHLADRTGEALEAVREAEAVVERFENRYWCAKLHRLRGVFSPLPVLTRPKLRLRYRKP